MWVRHPAAMAGNSHCLKSLLILSLVLGAWCLVLLGLNVMATVAQPEATDQSGQSTQKQPKVREQSLPLLTELMRCSGIRAVLPNGDGNGQDAPATSNQPAIRQDASSEAKRVKIGKGKGKGKKVDGRLAGVRKQSRLGGLVVRSF